MAQIDKSGKENEKKSTKTGKNDTNGERPAEMAKHR